MSKKDDDREAVKRAFEKEKDNNKDWDDRPNKDSWIDKALTGDDDDDDDKK